MNQPPTILEGDEEIEGVGQVGEGTHFPHTGVQSQAPRIHDTVATASDLQPREDEGVGYGHTPTLQNEMIAVSGDVTTEAAQQAEYKQPSSVESPIIDDEAKVGEPPATDAENEIQGRLDEQGGLAGISEDEIVIDESTAIHDAEQPVPTMAQSPTPQAEESGLALIEEDIKMDESLSVSMSLVS